MLTYKEIENIVACAMDKYRSENGTSGWNKDDIKKAIDELGGDKSDLYRAMSAAMDICIGNKEGMQHILS
ncbi:MAG: hypothetical protein VB031_00015 [Eubacteriaceae bacterium]|nr:hypothetical protein [Eubacteriaceae bacterium]